MKNLRPEEENIVKDVRNLFRLEKLKKTIDTTIKDIRKRFRLEKENKAIKDRILKGIRNVFRLGKENNTIKDMILNYIINFSEKEEEENYSKPVRVSNFWSNNYIEFESNSGTNEILSVEEYLNKIRSYLKDIIKNLKKSNTWKVQLLIANNFISSIDNNKKHVIIVSSTVETPPFLKAPSPFLGTPIFLKKIKKLPPSF